jgi:hypothetical protein
MPSKGEMNRESKNYKCANLVGLDIHSEGFLLLGVQCSFWLFPFQTTEFIHPELQFMLQKEIGASSAQDRSAREKERS